MEKILTNIDLLKRLKKTDHFALHEAASTQFGYLFVHFASLYNLYLQYLQELEIEEYYLSKYLCTKDNPHIHEADKIKAETEKRLIVARNRTDRALQLIQDQLNRLHFSADEYNISPEDRIRIMDIYDLFYFFFKRAKDIFEGYAADNRPE